MLVEFLSNLNVKPLLHERKAPPHKHKAPYWRLSGDGSVRTYHISSHKQLRFKLRT